MIKNFNEIRVGSGRLWLETKDMRGKPQAIDIMKFSEQELYELMVAVYKLGDKNARTRIQDALEGRGPDYTHL